MCSHYQVLKERAKFEKAFNVKLPPYEGVYDVWPMYQALFVRRPLEADVGDDAVPEREALPGMFGLIAKRLLFLWRIDTGQPNLVLNLVGIQHRDGVAIGHIDNLAQQGIGLHLEHQAQHQHDGQNQAVPLTATHLTARHPC